MVLNPALFKYCFKKVSALFLIAAAFFLFNTRDSLAKSADEFLSNANLRKTNLEDFVIYSEFEISKQDLLEIRRNLSNARRMIGQDLGNFPEFKFEVIVSTKQTFHDYSQTPESVSALFDGRIHIPVPSEVDNRSKFKSIIWHEYTHAVTYMVSLGRCPLWLCEGFSVYEESRVIPIELDRLIARIAEKNALAFNINNLENVLSGIGQTDSADIRIAYDQSYCFVDYLFSRYSKSKIQNLLKTFSETPTPELAFKKALNIDLSAIEDKWLAHIESMTK